MTTDAREPTCWRIMGYKDHDEFLRKTRARTRIMSLILRKQSEAQRVTPEMLNRVVNL